MRAGTFSLQRRRTEAGSRAASPATPLPRSRGGRNIKSDSIFDLRSLTFENEPHAKPRNTQMHESHCGAVSSQSADALISFCLLLHVVMQHDIVQPQREASDLSNCAQANLNCRPSTHTLLASPAPHKPPWSPCCANNIAEAYCGGMGGSTQKCPANCPFSPKFSRLSQVCPRIKETLTPKQNTRPHISLRHWRATGTPLVRHWHATGMSLVKEAEITPALAFAHCD